MALLKMIKLIALFLLIITIKLSSAYAEDYTILAFGDSLTAGYGLPAEQGFTSQLEQHLKNHPKNQGHDIAVINGGLSGDTSSGGLSRLSWVLSSLEGGPPDMVIVELGANDALRGISPEITRRKLEQILIILRKARIKILLTGMIAPPNMGPRYGTEFNRIFPELARKYGADLYPFFLTGVAGRPGLNQKDGIHPNAQGVKTIVDNITPYVLTLMK